MYVSFKNLMLMLNTKIVFLLQYLTEIYIKEHPLGPTPPPPPLALHLCSGLRRKTISEPTNSIYLFKRSNKKTNSERMSDVK